MLLLFEYLHAHAGWFADAPPSLRSEGRAMLLAVADDLVAAGIPATVALCPEAADSLSLNLPVVLTSGNTPIEIATELSGTPYVSEVFPIAPECDRILAELAVTFRKARLKVHVISNADIECFSDKWKTFEFLDRHRIPTVPTWQVNDWLAGRFDDEPVWVTKPRDGLSCDGIRRCSAKELGRLIASGRISNASHVIQPFVNGTSWSSAFLRRGAEVLLLPAVCQNIVWKERQAGYMGGTVCAYHTNSEIEKLATQVIQQLPNFSGYLGLDYIVDAVSGLVSVMEINPRLCSSYVGYRQATESNLMNWMLRKTAEKPEWLTSGITF